MSHEKAHPGKDHPIVEVAWWDAIEVLDWKDNDVTHPNRPAPSWSVGYLLIEDDAAITLASLHNECHWSLGITIPRGMIHEIRFLTPVKRGK